MHWDSPHDAGTDPPHQPPEVNPAYKAIDAMVQQQLREPDRLRGSLEGVRPCFGAV